MQVKQLSKDRIFQSASSIVEQVLRDKGDLELPESARPKPANLIRMANYCRQKMRPEEPKTLDFQVFLCNQFAFIDFF